MIRALRKFVAREQQRWVEARAAARTRRGGPVAAGPSVRTRYTARGRQEQALRAGGVGFWSARPLEGQATARGGSADVHLQYELDEMRARAQELDRNNPIYTAVLDRFCDVILGEHGLTLQARTAVPALNRRLEELWWRHGQDPEVRGLDDEAQLQRLALRQMVNEGDVGAILDAASGRVQMIEGERIASVRTSTADGRRIQQGVELLGPPLAGRPAAFWIAPYDEWGQVRPGEAVRVAADDFLYLAHRKRSSQTRGIPIQQCNFAMFDRIEDVCDSEAAAWQLLSRIALIVTRENAEELAHSTSTPAAQPDDYDLGKRVQQLAHSLIYYAKPGENIAGVNHNIPGANFVESLKMFLRLLGLPFGFSLEFVLLIWSDTTFSSGRASQKLVERAVKPWAGYLAQRFCQRRYAWQVRRWVVQGLVPARADAFDAAWVAQPMPFLDPKAEATAMKLRFETGTTAPSLEATEQGRDFEELLATQFADLERIASFLERYNAQHPLHPLTMADITGFVREKKGNEAQRQAGTEAERDEGTEAQRHRGTEAEGDGEADGEDEADDE